MPRRMPIGFTFCPLGVSLSVRHLNQDVTAALRDAHAAPLGARVNREQRRRIDSIRSLSDRRHRH